MEHYRMTKRLQMNAVQRGYLHQQMQLIQRLFQEGRRYRNQVEQPSAKRILAFVCRRSARYPTMNFQDCEAITRQLCLGNTVFQFDNLLEHYCWHHLNFFHMIKLTYGWQKSLLLKPWQLLENRFYERDGQYFIQLYFVRY